MALATKQTPVARGRRPAAKRAVNTPARFSLTSLMDEHGADMFALE